MLNAGAGNFHYAGRSEPEKWFELLDIWKINKACFTFSELRIKDFEIKISIIENMRKKGMWVREG
ncbi:MAG: hypothetical protein ACQESU_08755 [Halobacteriota archaeon]